jgi:hypothetical protein
MAIQILLSKIVAARLRGGASSAGGISESAARRPRFVYGRETSILKLEHHFQ